MSSDIAISVKNVSKNFKLPHERVDSLKSVFVNPFNKNSRKYESQHALKDISFDIKKGEFFGIVGRNGSGKSTLLKIIAGIYQPNEGSVTVNGRLVPFIELGVGFNPELTGRENTYLNGALMGFHVKEIDNKYKQIVEFAELEKFMDQKLKNYSSGMQVRLAFSVATILAESDILLIDEVLAVGDADFQKKCFSYFKNLKKNNKTVIFVSHDMGSVREYCDRAILIEDSEIIFSGKSDDTAKKYTQLFLNTNPTIDQVQEELTKWGAGGVDMQDVSLTKSIYNKDDKFISFSYDIIPDSNINDEVLIGLVVKDESGQLICGTNSSIIEYTKKIILKPGVKTKVSWKVPNIFNDGKFTVDIAVDSLNSGELMQWWNEAAKFSVVNEQGTPYIVAPKITLDVN